MTNTSGSYGYPGVDEFLAHAEKYKYAAVRRDSGFAVQFKDPDTNQMKSMMGVDSTKNNFVIQNNYDYSRRQVGRVGNYLSRIRKKFHGPHGKEGGC